LHRLDWENAFHHVMTRGMEKRTIFEEDLDLYLFVDRLQKCAIETGIHVFAWVLMPNHIHLLTKTGGVPLSTFMHKLLTGHASYYNRKYGRVGHLFQNRYRSILVQTEVYFHSLIRYIHLNPLKAGIVSDLADLNEYRWSGHFGLIHADVYAWQDTDAVLRDFAGDPANQIRSYTDFLMSIDEDISDLMFDEGSFIIGPAGLHTLANKSTISASASGNHRILGNRSFAESVLARLKCNRGTPIRDRESEHAIIDQLIQLIQMHWMVDKNSLLSGRRTRRSSRAREFLSYCLVDELGLSLTDAAGIQHLSSQGVDQALKRFRSEIKCNSIALKTLLEDVQAIIRQRA